MMFEPFERGPAKIVPGAPRREASLVTDDLDHDPPRTERPNGWDRARERLRLQHALTVCDALYFGPFVVESARPHRVSHRKLGSWRCVGNETSLYRELMEEDVVTDEGVVEIDTHDQLRARHGLDTGMLNVDRGELRPVTPRVLGDRMFSQYSRNARRQGLNDPTFSDVMVVTMFLRPSDENSR